MSNVEKFHSASKSQDEPANFKLVLQHEPVDFKLICSTNQRISILFAVQLRNQQISNSFAALTSKFQTYLQYKPANFNIIYEVHCTSAFTADRQASLIKYILIKKRASITDGRCLLIKTRK